MLSLSCGVMNSAGVEQAAALLGLATHTVLDILFGERALVDGAVIDEHDAVVNRGWSPATFMQHSGVAGLVQADPRLKNVAIWSIDVDEEHRHLLQPPVTLPTDDLGEALLDVVEAVEVWNRPYLQDRTTRQHVQAACDKLFAFQHTGVRARPWVTAPEQLGLRLAPREGRPSGGEVLPPLDDVDPTQLKDVVLLTDLMAMVFPYVTVVVADSGLVVDHFATRGLRCAGHDGDTLLFVEGGVPAAECIDPTPALRDVKARRWVDRPLPAALHGVVAGGAADPKWTLAIDLRRQRGHRLSPHWVGDRTLVQTSADFRHAWDDRFIIDLEHDRRALDTQRPALAKLGRNLSFVQRADGRWRFATDRAVFDEDGLELLRWHRPTFARLEAQGQRVGVWQGGALRVIDLTTKAEASYDLSALLPALTVPPGEAKWKTLLTMFGIAEAIASQTPAQIRALAATMFDPTPFTDRELALVQAAAAAHPRLPDSVQLRRAD